MIAMDEFLKRKEALALVQPDGPEDEKAAVTIATAKKLVRSIVLRTPAADVAPVVHGRWKVSGGLLECQNCGEIYSTRGGNEGKAWDYCPNCGARMDGDSDD